MNPAPDADLNSVGKESFEWIVDRIAKLAVKKAQSADKVAPQMNWASFLASPATKKSSTKTVPKSAPKKSAKKKTKKNE
jgi:hypothetical protein